MATAEEIQKALAIIDQIERERLARQPSAEPGLSLEETIRRIDQENTEWRKQIKPYYPDAVKLITNIGETRKAVDVLRSHPQSNWPDLLSATREIADETAYNEKRPGFFGRLSESFTSGINTPFEMVEHAASGVTAEESDALNQVWQIAQQVMPGPMEIAITVLLLGFIFIRIRRAFAEAGFRHPMLPTLPVGAAVWFAFVFAVQVLGVVGLLALPLLLVVVVVAISNTWRKASNREHDSGARENSRASLVRLSHRGRGYSTERWRHELPSFQGDQPMVSKFFGGAAFVCFLATALPVTFYGFMVDLPDGFMDYPTPIRVLLVLKWKPWILIPLAGSIIAAILSAIAGKRQSGVSS